jgi:acetyl esterase/lipase
MNRSKFPKGWILATTIMVVALSTSNPVRADRITVSVAELDQALYELEFEPDAISRLALLKIQSEINAAGLALLAGEVLFSESVSDVVVDSGCNSTEIRTVDTTVALGSGFSISLNLDSLYEPINLSLKLDARISVSGRAKQTVGFRLGSCQQLANDNFSFTASGSASLNLSLSLQLNPSLDHDSRSLIVRPEVALSGNLVNQGITVHVSDSLLRNILEDYLEDEIDDALNNAQIVSAIEALEQGLSDALAEQLDNGEITIELPSPTDEQIDTLYILLSPSADFSLSLGYMRTERVALLAALILNDTAAIEEVLSDAVQCEAAGFLQASLMHEPVYRVSDLGCELTQIPTASVTGQDVVADPWFIDARCQLPLDYFETSTVDYCTQVLDTQRLGNADSFQDELGRWTLSPGTRFDIGAVPLAGKQQPFTQRVNYKSVSTSMGECALEMRIHSTVPTSNAQTEALSPSRAVIAFHGGSWQRRSSGALGIESLATQFVNAGYVVFAPFYRLIGTDEGNDACNDATLGEVLEDAHDALSWVQSNGARYGVQDKPILFGQSAGGHLAAVLAVERPDEIKNAVLFYAPTDFAEFARQLIDGEITTETGKGILEAVIGETLETLDIQDPIVQRNALAARVVNGPASLPPFFLLHGQKDTVLPVSQSIRMCNALAGNPELGPATRIDVSTGALRSIVSCGNAGSELHLIAEGEHALDLCIDEELCLSGSPASARLTKDSIKSMLSWISEVPVNSSPLQDGNSDGLVSSSGGGIGCWGLLALILGNFARRICR